MTTPLLDCVNIERIVSDTLQLVQIPSPTGDSREAADHYAQLLAEAGCRVDRYEFLPNNPTLVAVFEGGLPGKTILFNGHLDTIPLAHSPARIEDGRVYGRGANDMKGSLACIVEVIRVIRDSRDKLKGRLIIVANSLHESPGGRGEDLYALVENVSLQADAAIVMEGATRDCTIAQFGSATFEIVVKRNGEPSHQLYTPEGTPHPISVMAEIVRQLDERNEQLRLAYIEDIGYASYFVGAVQSGKFYNQHPNTAELVGVRRYGPETEYADVERELRLLLDDIARRNKVDILLKLQKVRDGYRIDKNDPAVHALVEAARKVRGIPLPAAGKKLVTDAGVFAKNLSIPTLCHGPDQTSAHADIEYVEIRELELSAKVYLQFIVEFGLLSE